MNCAPRQSITTEEFVSGKEAAEIRFWNKVKKSDDPDGCWIWVGGKSSRGYGNFSVRTRAGIYRNYRAPRFAWLITYGDISEGCVICHRCDTPLCVRPDHLWLGTQSENIQDCVNKGRRIREKYSRHRPHKLNLEKAREIRLRYTGRYGEKAELARQYGVSFNMIHDILKGESWPDPS